MFRDVTAPLDERMSKGGSLQWITLTVCIQIGKPATRDREADNRFNISVSGWGWRKLAAPIFFLSPCTPCLHSASLPGDDGGGCGGAAAAAAGQLASRWKSTLGVQPAWTVIGLPGLPKSRGALGSVQHDAVTGTMKTHIQQICITIQANIWES